MAKFHIKHKVIMTESPKKIDISTGFNMTDVNKVITQPVNNESKMTGVSSSELQKLTEEMLKSNNELKDLLFTAQPEFTAKEIKTFTPSRYQNDIFDFVRVQIDKMQMLLKPENLQVIAGAGCAKTTTLVKITEFIPKIIKDRALFATVLAFNRDIVAVLKDKVPNHVRVQTFHSAGFAALRYRFKNVKVDDNKMFQIFYDISGNLTKDEKEGLLMSFIKLIGYLKNTGLSPTSESLNFLIEEYNLDIDLEEDNTLLFELVKQGIIQSNSNPLTVDFNDQCYLPVILNLQFFKQDIILVDEAQDLNAIQLKMMRMMLKPTGFIVLVGDPNQAIYRFRGAEAGGMDRMRVELNMKVLPLLETYRCGKKIVQFANQLVPELVAYKDNPEGEVLEDISKDKLYDLIKEGDMVLCRNNAPLLEYVFHLLSKGIKVSIKGRDIGQGLIKIIKKFKARNLEEFYLKLEEWKNNETKKATMKKSLSMIDTIEDKYQCLLSISDDCKNVNDIIIKIEKIFDDARSAIIFSSVHKSKGLESDRVYIISPELMPSKYAIRPKEIREERNIIYVSITRPKTSLFIVGGELNLNF